MSIQDFLWRLKAASAGPRSAFLILFIGVVVGPLVLFAIGGRSSTTPEQSGLAWLFLAIALLLLISIGIGFFMFRRNSAALTISPKYH